MKRLCAILLLAAALSLPAQVLSAEKQPAPPVKQEAAQPTQVQLLAAQQTALQERLQRLEAQYALTQQQLAAVLTQQKALEKAKEDKNKK